MMLESYPIKVVLNLWFQNQVSFDSYSISASVGNDEWEKIFNKFPNDAV